MDRLEAASASGSASEAGAPITKFSLWTGGTKLRGANIWITRSYGGKESSIGPVKVGPAYTQDDFDRLAALGANYVNISHAGIFTEKAPFTADPDALARLDGILAQIAKADMFAVISFRSGPGRSEFTFNREHVGEWFTAEDVDETLWTDKAKQDAWADMWRYAAERYRSNPIVVGYDVVVEPNANALLPGVDEPKDFYPKYAGSLYDPNRLYDRVVPAIRRVDKRTPILIQAAGWGGVAWLPFLKKRREARIVYAVHNYEPQESYTHQPPSGKHSYPGTYDLGGGEVERFDKRWIDGLLEPADAYSADGSAIAINEYGVQRWVPRGAAYMRDSMALMEKRGWNHALWDWHSVSMPVDWSEPHSWDYDAFDFMHGPDPAKHADIKASALLSVIKADWAQNKLRPSNVAFVVEE